MATSVDTKRVIVTGGARGLGFALTQQLLQKGAKSVSILDCDSSQGVKSVEALNEKFGDNKAFFFPCDISESDQFESAFKVAVEKLGGLDIFVNNAGILNDRKWNLTVDVNLKGVVQGTLLAVETMGKHNGGNGGTVLNVASIAGVRVNKFYPVYIGTKHGVVAFSRSIAASFDKTGVSVKVICPDPAETDLLVKLKEKTLDFIDGEELSEYMEKWEYQSAETMAQTMLRLIEEAPNEAVWLQPYKESPKAVLVPNIESILAPISGK